MLATSREHVRHGHRILVHVQCDLNLGESSALDLFSGLPDKAISDIYHDVRIVAQSIYECQANSA